MLQDLCLISRRWKEFVATWIKKVLVEAVLDIWIDQKGAGRIGHIMNLLQILSIELYHNWLYSSSGDIHLGPLSARKQGDEDVVSGCGGWWILCKAIQNVMFLAAFRTTT